jgi:hypothetical protein
VSSVRLVAGLKLKARPRLESTTKRNVTLGVQTTQKPVRCRRGAVMEVRVAIGEIGFFRMAFSKMLVYLID